MGEKKKYIGHKQTMKAIEDFMEDSGIREICSNICHGSCCGRDCFTSDKACHKNEGRRVACSIFLCGKITRIFNEEQRKVYFDIKDAVMQAVFKNKYTKGSEFFDPPTDIPMFKKTYRTKDIRRELKNLSWDVCSNFRELRDWMHDARKNLVADLVLVKALKAGQANRIYAGVDRVYFDTDEERFILKSGVLTKKPIQIHHSHRFIDKTGA